MSSVSSSMAPPATHRPFSRMQNSLATRRAKGSFCSTSSTVTPASRLSFEDDVADLVHDVRLNPFGRLVENEQRRLEHERAADRELLLLPAGQIAAAPVQHLLQHREQLEDLFRNRARAVLAHAEADAQVLLDGQLREDFAPLGHVADAEPRAALRREPAQIGPGERDLAGGRRQQSHDALQQRGLAHAVAAHEAGARSLRHHQVDVPQGVAAAVGLVEGFSA